MGESSPLFSSSLSVLSLQLLALKLSMCLGERVRMTERSFVCVCVLCVQLKEKDTHREYLSGQGGYQSSHQRELKV